MNATLEPCRAGFDGCEAMRAEAVRRHPRTPSARECRHYPIPPERPERLQGPEVGTLCVYRNPRSQWDGQTVEIVERSYVWAPGERTGSRRYDLKVIRFVATGKTMLVDDKDLAPL